MRHLVVGLVLFALGIWGIISWWNVFGLVMRGIVPFLLLILGLVAVLSGIRRVPSNGANAVAPDESQNRAVNDA
jgi:hypothetical protein